MQINMGVSKNNGTPKWMAYKGNSYEQMDDLRVPLYLETPIYLFFRDFPYNSSVI